MRMELNPDDADSVDKRIRSSLRVTTGSTYAALVRKTTEAETPLDFVRSMRLACAWLWPRLTARTRPMYDEIAALLEEIRAYVRASSNRVWHPPLTVRVSRTAEKAERASRYTAKRERAMALFEQADSTLRLEPLLASQEAFKHAQRERASKPRKLDESVCQRIAKVYWESKSSGSGYGVAKALAAEYNVSTTTIHATARKYKALN